MYAVIRSGGKQYRVEEGEVVRLELLGVDPGSSVEFSEVLLVKKGKRTHIGQPLVEGATVKGLVQENGKGDKILVFKFKKKQQYKRLRGHRQQYSDVRIESIAIAKKKASSE